MINENKALIYFVEHIQPDEKLGKSIVPVKMYLSYLKTDAKIYLPGKSSSTIKQILKEKPKTINGVQETYELLAQNLVHRILADKIIREQDRSLGIKLKNSLTVFQRTPDFLSGNMLVTMLKSENIDGLICHQLSIGGVAVSGFIKQNYVMECVQLYGPKTNFGQSSISLEDIRQATISFLDHLLLLEKRKRDILPHGSQTDFP